MMTDASDMLAAALEQMDGIIAGSKALEYSNGIYDCQSPTSPFMGSLRVLHLVEDLRGLLELMETEEKEGLRCQIPDSTAELLVGWLQGHMANGHISLGADIYQERLVRLESDKESLVLQVSVLTDQVEAQGEKIRDLEFCLEEHREKLNATEEMLQQELLSRTSLETQKLDLMTEISNLKLKLTAVEKDYVDYEERFKDTEGLIREINELRFKVTEMENERAQYDKKLKSTKDELKSLKDQLEQKEAEVKRLTEEFVSRMPLDSTDGEKVKLLDAPLEKQKLFGANAQDVLKSIEEKDRKIEDLRQALNRYKKVQDMVLLVQDKAKDDQNEHHLDGVSGTIHTDVQTLVESEKSPPTSVLSTAAPLQDINGNAPEQNPVQVHTSVLQVSIPAFSSVPKTSDDPAPKKNMSEENSKVETSGVKIPDILAVPETRLCDSPVTPVLQKSSSLDNLKKSSTDMRMESPPQTPLENKAYTEISRIGGLPPKPPGHLNSADDESFGTRKGRSSFGRGFFRIKSNKRTASAPNLAETEKGSAEHLDLTTGSSRAADSDTCETASSSPESRKKSKGLLKLFGRLKRSQSTTFNPDDLPEEEFRRGGTRATAGPRLGWSRDLGQVNSDVDAPFAKWTKDQVCNWLKDLGLGMYVNIARQWVKSGQTLLQASQQDLEKELGMKHPLHRKKLQLAVQALGSEEEDNKSKLDYSWVTRWLDDIGLPQYKTQFDEGRVDGRMLHYMTVDDLLSLKVVSVLHHLSIKRAIQVLRINNFEPNCLRRRPSDENNITPAEVTQWTNHRVMEWLRSVDLAEYAPNLRGSGVHGGLMVLEPRFNVETMALLLNIPPNKTLLRRHLATHFNLLIGQEAQRLKRESLECPDYVLLTATAKVKPKKLVFSNFGSLRRKKQDDTEEYICPMELGLQTSSSSQKGTQGTDARVYNDDDLDNLEQMEDSEGTVRQIGAFSEGINNLTHMLKEDEMFKDLSTRSPTVSITDEDSNV
ncbi:liprin-beta-1 [Protopterus annectens]|uniref:liprin-beta-1 n=1 Tax=Protopterus annectens TaxID=7888 RepID=UPI001CFAD152|nr:liprin-beta-1 [Protopterus annectens]